MKLNQDRLVDRFVKYARIDTQSDPESKATPSTPGQLVLATIVAEDMRQAGIADVQMMAEGFVFGTIPENLPENHPAKGKAPTLGFLAHFDTAGEAPGANVEPQFIKNYQGGAVRFPKNPEITLTPDTTPHLKRCIGHTLITSDGTTLLGGGDKAGIALLVELAHACRENPEILHGKIRLAIIPDEEIGVGTEKLDLKTFSADVAYTFDGGEMGEIDIESFNGFMGKVEVEGYAAFPGYGKGVYLNAIQVLSKFIAAMEDRRWPQNSDGRDPIWWIQSMEGKVARASAAVYLRDFDLQGIEKQKQILAGVRQQILKEFPKAKIAIDIDESYRNYKFLLEKDPRIVAYAEEAMRRIGIEPRKNYVRGGNDACHLCVNGLLSTNLFVGMQNMHSLAEWNTVESIEGALKTAISLCGVWLDHSV
ncbi:MAG: peptidase T [Pseudomonadota bacterium]